MPATVAELGAGVWSFSYGRSQVEQPDQLGHPRPIPDLAVGVIAGATRRWR